MILLKILDHDLHKSRGIVKDTPIWWIETPARANFLPALVSSTQSGRFLVSRKMTGDGRIRSGVFSHDSDRLDEIIMPMFNAAFELSTAEKWNNIFTKPKEAFNYIQKHSNEVQPHIVLIPESWSRTKLIRWIGRNNIAEVSLDESVKESKAKTTAIIYCRICKIISCRVSIPVFLSRPDFVGMYTQIVGGKTSILLHNVRYGMAFCICPEKN
jgi:hypothetical protein